MERPVRAKFNTQIYEEACEWFIECRAGDLDDSARAEFDRWLRKSPEHQSAYLEIAAIWNEGPTLDPANRWDLGSLIGQAADASGNVVALERTPRPPLPASHALQPVPLPTPMPATPVGRRRSFAIAASILLLTVAIATYLFTPRGVYATALGEQRSLALNDGSTVELNSLSKIRIRYTDHERTVELIEGQALFQVAKDAARPFVVYSGQTRVRAVGTEFDVYRKKGSTIITVVEGRVAILGVPENLAPGTGYADYGPAARAGQAEANSANPGPALPAPPGAILLAAGEQITVTSEAARRTPHANLAGATAWTQRQLVFDSASLAEVAAEFNRYNERKLVIDPAALGTQHISGVFSSTDPASLIHFLRDRPGLRVTETPTEIRVDQQT